MFILSDLDENIQAIPECVENATREEMEMVFLGTGSSQPSKYRNVSAIYVHLFGKGGILLDCGEGTYAQLKRRYMDYYIYFSTWFFNMIIL